MRSLRSARWRRKRRRKPNGLTGLRRIRGWMTSSMWRMSKDRSRRLKRIPSRTHRRLRGVMRKSQKYPLVRTTRMSKTVCLWSRKSFKVTMSRKKTSRVWPLRLLVVREMTSRAKMLTLRAILLKSAPLRATPSRATPLRVAPLKTTSLKTSSSRATPLRVTHSSRAVPLRATQLTVAQSRVTTLLRAMPLKTAPSGMMPFRATVSSCHHQTMKTDCRNL
mmetsp:Transcript_30215/g.98282  ORF Transcript_30215/g.98282 Transcript_30215/m.98282 type:complete len:220 (+) Transcript_30215:617-1276(+)